MLDVHPPHHPTNTWRDFFIHIATIVVGLLIAIGLEQTVERIHQHYELRETREALARETEANRKDIAKDVRQWRWEMAELENNLIVLRYIKQHPGTPQSALPGILEWSESPQRFETAVWAAAEQNGITRRMSPEEANHYREIYVGLKVFGQQGLDDWNAFNDAGRYRSFDPDPTHMTPEDIDRTLQALQVNMEKHIQVGDSLAMMHLRLPELGSSLTFTEIAAFQPDLLDKVPPGLEAASKLTQARLKAANAGKP
jgi:hypothetical protein